MSDNTVGEEVEEKTPTEEETVAAEEIPKEDLTPTDDVVAEIQNPEDIPLLFDPNDIPLLILRVPSN